jgi:uncharacterized membrane protein
VPEEKTNSIPAPDPEELAQTPEEELADKLAEQADAVTAGLRDLLPDSKPTGYEDVRPTKGPLETTVLSESAEMSAKASVPDETVTVAEPPAESAEDAAVVLTQTSPAIQADRVTEASFAAAGAPVESSSDDRLMSALAWLTLVILQLPIVSVIQLLSATTRERSFQRHHAITSLLFFAAAIVYEVVAGIVYTILGALTLGCGYACLWVIFFLPHALGLYYALQAYNGKTIELPVLSNFGRQQGWM